MSRAVYEMTCPACRSQFTTPVGKTGLECPCGWKKNFYEHRIEERAAAVVSRVDWPIPDSVRESLKREIVKELKQGMGYH